jgi:hypothetical protein
MRRILRFSEIGEARRRIKQIDILIDYKYAEAELFVRKQNLSDEMKSVESDGKSFMESCNSTHSNVGKLSSKVGLQTTMIEEVNSTREANSSAPNSTREANSSAPNSTREEKTE